AKVDRVVIKRMEKDKELDETEFVSSADDRWYLKKGDQQVRVEGFKIDKQMIEQIRKAKHEETADVSKDQSFYGLNNPQLVVTLSGELGVSKKDWVFTVGKESAD